MKIPISVSGGLPVSEDCTATVARVRQGFTAITSDSDDEAVEGTMPDNGAVDITLAAGSSYTIPHGYHNGSGEVKSSAQYSTVQTGYVACNRSISGGSAENGTVSTSSSFTIPAAAYNIKCYYSFAIGEIRAYGNATATIKLGSSSKLNSTQSVGGSASSYMYNNTVNGSFTGTAGSNISVSLSLTKTSGGYSYSEIRAYVFVAILYNI